MWAYFVVYNLKSSSHFVTFLFLNWDVSEHLISNNGTQLKCCTIYSLLKTHEQCSVDFFSSKILILEYALHQSACVTYACTDSSHCSTKPKIHALVHQVDCANRFSLQINFDQTNQEHLNSPRLAQLSSLLVSVVEPCCVTLPRELCAALSSWWGHKLQGKEHPSQGRGTSKLFPVWAEETTGWGSWQGCHPHSSAALEIKESLCANKSLEYSCLMGLACRIVQRVSLQPQASKDAQHVNRETEILFSLSEHKI